MKARIVEITEWSRDEPAIAGDASHEGDAAVLRLVADEIQEKLEDCTHVPPGLPFVQELDVLPCREDDVDDIVKHALLGMYVEEHYQFAYVKPTDCVVEWEDLAKRTFRATVEMAFDVEAFSEGDAVSKVMEMFSDGRASPSTEEVTVEELSEKDRKERL